MLVTVNLSKEVFEYFKDYDLSVVADTLLEIYDFTAMPACSMPRYTERKIEVTNLNYIEMYNLLGARNKKVSLGRLFEFAYNMDVLNTEIFKSMRIERKQVDDSIQYLKKALANLYDARRYDGSVELRDIASALNYYITIKE